MSDLIQKQIKHLEDQVRVLKQSDPTQANLPEPLQAFPGTAKALEAFVDAKVAEGIKKHAATVAVPVAPPNQFYAVAQQLLLASLKPAEVAWIVEHVGQGSPGFAQFLQSESIKTVVQVGFETYKEFLEGKTK